MTAAHSKKMKTRGDCMVASVNVGSGFNARMGAT